MTGDFSSANRKVSSRGLSLPTRNFARRIERIRLCAMRRQGMSRKEAFRSRSERILSAIGTDTGNQRTRQPNARRRGLSFFQEGNANAGFDTEGKRNDSHRTRNYNSDRPIVGRSGSPRDRGAERNQDPSRRTAQTRGLIGSHKSTSVVPWRPRSFFCAGRVQWQM